jgi:hypothetical protein
MRKNLLIFILLFTSGLCYSNLQSQSIIKQDGKYGLADDKGNILLKTEYDKIEQFDESTPSCFIVKKNKKFGYVYKVELDSTVWLNEKNRHWTFSKLEFDTIYGFIIGGARYSTSFGYTTMAYKKNNRWGMICIQTHAGSGDGIFPSMAFYVGGMGKAIVREAKYDTIFQREAADNFYTTRLNGKYGFWEPTTNEVYEPEFDSIPLTIYSYKNHGDLPRNRYVSKNGKWGLVYLNKEKKSLEYKVPCMCNGLGRVRFGTYFCMGQNDTLQFYNAITRETYKPLIDGKQLQTVFYWNPHDTPPYSLKEYIGRGPSFMGTDSMYYWLQSIGDSLVAIYKANNQPEALQLESMSFPYRTTIGIYFVDLKNKKNVFQFTEPGWSYEIIRFYESDPIYSPLIIKGKYDEKTNMYIREYYDAKTGEFKFRLQTAEKYVIVSLKEKERGETKKYWFSFTCHTNAEYWKEEGVVRGYYNLQTKKFSKRKK